MEDKREIRNTSHRMIVDKEERIIEGYALLFNVPSDGLSFEEEIQRGALDGVIESSDVFALLNHEQSRGVLARCKKGVGSLHLEIDEIGLKFRFKAPNTALGDELIENILRGEVDESSFSFVVDEDKWSKKSDGTYKRSITKIKQLFDVSPVYSAAYSQTSVCMRGKEREEAYLRGIEQRDLDKYYETVEKTFNL